MRIVPLGGHYAPPSFGADIQATCGFVVVYLCSLEENIGRVAFSFLFPILFPNRSIRCVPAFCDAGLVLIPAAYHYHEFESPRSA